MSVYVYVSMYAVALQRTKPVGNDLEEGHAHKNLVCVRVYVCIHYDDPRIQCA